MTEQQTINKVRDAICGTPADPNRDCSVLNSLLSREEAERAAINAIAAVKEAMDG